MGLIPVGDSDVFFVPRLCHVHQFAFHISLPSLTIYHLYSFTIVVVVCYFPHLQMVISPFGVYWELFDLLCGIVWCDKPG